jgi:hypothetical protein
MYRAVCKSVANLRGGGIVGVKNPQFIGGGGVLHH